MTLPPAAELVPVVAKLPEDERSAYLDRYAPEVDELADTPAIAAYLGLQPRSIHRERSRARADRAAWPEPARMFGRSPAWTWRSVILHRAAMPGPGYRR